MKSVLRTSLAAVAATLLIGTATAFTTPSDVTTASAAHPAKAGIVKLGTAVNLPSGVWTDTPLEVTLPRAGTYALDADVRGRLAGTPALNTYISARLWNVNSGAEVPQSERLVYQIIDLNAGSATAGGNQTAPISELIRVGGPTTIRLQARRIDAVGAASIAQIYSDNSGYTSLRYERVGF
ncbi:hypothetical protein ACIRQQ_31405 [Streptomyces fuscichromogenes]|uniref:hypothetical protein n=1 Tax=Streptomyces fuscichromogenes TaxID=1324013 RepID=UPI0037F92AAF